MLDISTTKKQVKKYIIISLFFLAFSLVYEYYSHNIYSYYMLSSFIYPLIMGVIVYTLIYKTKVNEKISILGVSIYNSSILTLTLGSVMKGVLEIYGTTNQLVSCYSILGMALLIISLFIIFLKAK